MRRRQFLVSGALLSTASLAGCVHPEVVLDLRDATAGPFTHESSRREERAYELIEAIAREQRIPPSELLLQVDTKHTKKTK